MSVFVCLLFIKHVSKKPNKQKAFRLKMYRKLYEENVVLNFTNGWCQTPALNNVQNAYFDLIQN